MIHFVDTHCHLYDEAFDADRGETLQRALDAGVDTLLLPDIDSSTTTQLDALYEQSPSCFRRMTGLHPTSVKEDFEQELKHVHDRLFSSPRGTFVAIGEIGMDLYWERTFEVQQREVFKTQMRWAKETGLPVCLHIRKAHNEVFGLLRDMGGKFRGVMHCFGGSLQEARRAVDMGFYLGIGGVVTFKNATMAEVAKEIPLDRLLLETDAPYLSPVPYRGKRNESAYIPLIAEKIAALRGISLQEVADRTTENARRLFNL